MLEELKYDSRQVVFSRMGKHHADVRRQILRKLGVGRILLKLISIASY